MPPCLRGESPASTTYQWALGASRAVWLLPVLLAMIVCAPPDARADEPAALATQAHEQFREGREALKRGDLERALSLFQSSNTLYPAAGTLINLATCEERLGKIAAAWRHFQEAYAELPAGDDRKAIAAEHAAALEPRVPRLRLVRAPGAPADTTARRVDGTALEEPGWDTDLPLDPGTYSMAILAAGHEERRYAITLGEGERRTLVVEPGPETPLAVVAPPAMAPASTLRGVARAEPRAGVAAARGLAPAPAARPARTAGLVLGGIGVLGLGASAITGALAMAKNDELEGLCPSPKRCTPEGLEIESTGKALAAASTVSFAIGLASAGMSAYLLLTGSSDEKAKAAFAPALVPGGAGGVIRGAF